MLAFLIGTSIFNIFLGYALAVYLMCVSLLGEAQRRSSRPSSSAGAVLASERHERSDLYPADGDVASRASRRRRKRWRSEPRSGRAILCRPTSLRRWRPPSLPRCQMLHAVDRGPEEMDQQLLAGIEDFRSQLAKLRSETGSEEPKRRPAAQDEVNAQLAAPVTERVQRSPRPRPPCRPAAKRRQRHCERRRHAPRRRRRASVR